MSWSLSVHARRRLRRYSRLRPFHVVVLFNEERSVNVGSDWRSQHRLFYSRKEDVFFVALCNPRERCIITILPPNKHRDWDINAQCFEKAKEMAP